MSRMGGQNGDLRSLRDEVKLLPNWLKIGVQAGFGPNFTVEFESEIPKKFGLAYCMCTCAKLQGSHLGVVVTEESGGRGGPPKIQDLIPGSWAQRSDVLCVGDVIVGVNGVQASSVSRQSLRQVRVTQLFLSFIGLHSCPGQQGLTNSKHPKIKCQI